MTCAGENSIGPVTARWRLLRRGTAHGLEGPVARTRRGYVLLETVVATGLLVVGLAVIGAQIQDADLSVRKMDRRIRAIMLAEQHLAQLDLGLIELDSVDEIEEGDFGPRYPDFGWVLTTEDTAVENMYLLRLDVLHFLRDGEYREDEFEHDDADMIFTLYAMRPTPQPMDLGVDFGLSEEEVADLADRFSDLGIPGLDPQSFDPALLGKVDFEELIAALPVIMDALGMQLGDLSSLIPPDILRQIQESGVLDEAGESGLLDLLDGEGDGS